MPALKAVRLSGGGAHAELRRRPLRTPRRARRAWACPADPIDSASALPLSAGVCVPRPALQTPWTAHVRTSGAAARRMMRSWHQHLKLLQRFPRPRLAFTWEQPHVHGRLPRDQNEASREGRRWISASLGSARWASAGTAGLVGAGHGLVVFDTRREAVERLTTLGAKAAGSPREIADVVETVMVSLPTPDVVLAVATGPGGVIEGKRVRRFVDLSTTGAVMAKRISETLKGRN